MSPETVQTKIALLEKNDENIMTAFTDIKDLVGALSVKIDEYHKEADDKYARKTSLDKVWVIIWSVIGFVFMAVGAAFIKLVIIT